MSPLLCQLSYTATALLGDETNNDNSRSGVEVSTDCQSKLVPPRKELSGVFRHISFASSGSNTLAFMLSIVVVPTLLLISCVIVSAVKDLLGPCIVRSLSACSAFVWVWTSASGHLYDPSRLRKSCFMHMGIRHVEQLRPGMNNPAGCSKRQPSYPPNPRRAKTRLVPGKAAASEEAEVEVKVELCRLMPSQPRPEPQPFRKLADFFSSLLDDLIVMTILLDRVEQDVGTR
jgi:hypothetical protein